MSENETEVSGNISAEVEVTEVVGDPTDEQLVGMPDGSININPTTGDQEKIVYEYDTDGVFMGWHKEIA